MAKCIDVFLNIPKHSQAKSHNVVTLVVCRDINSHVDAMELVYRIALFVAGVINLLPSLLAFLPSKISTSYGIDVPNSNYELLLRHRAVLFAVIGGFMIFSAFTKRYYELSTGAGLISMLSFVLLCVLIGDGINAELKKVMIIDVVAIVILSMGAILFFVSSKRV